MEQACGENMIRSFFRVYTAKRSKEFPGNPEARLDNPCTSLKNTRGGNGFTLIELSIVLVVIGLIVGGVLVGRDLIRSAEIRALIGQIEKYQAAVNTFRGKYGHLPGDISDPYATQFGFIARGTAVSQGDGNGLIEGYFNPRGGFVGCCQLDVGETAVFWVDLSTARLIDGTFSVASSTIPTSGIAATGLSAYFPEAKIGNGNFVYVFGGGWPELSNNFTPTSDGNNYFGVEQMDDVGIVGVPHSHPNISVNQVYSIDRKIDEGLPMSGNMMADINDASYVWSNNTNTPLTLPYTAATPASDTSCFDNGNVTGNAQAYSILYNGGNNKSCAFTVKFQ